MPIVTVHLDLKRAEVADIAGKVQHVIGGFPLLLVGVEHLREGAEVPMAVLEIAIAAVVLATFFIEVRGVVRKRLEKGAHEHAHPKVGWFDLAAGILLIFEAFHGAHTKPGYLRPQFLSGMATLALGIFHAPLHRRRARRRYLKLDDYGVEYRLNRFRRSSMPWGDIEQVRVTPDQVAFEGAHGKRITISLRALNNGHHVREAIVGHSRVAALLGS